MSKEIMKTMKQLFLFLALFLFLNQSFSKGQKYFRSENGKSKLVQLTVMPTLKETPILQNRFELGIGGGIDYIICANGFVYQDFALSYKYNSRVSLNNKVGILLSETFYVYDYPNFKMCQYIGKNGFSISFGKEFSRVMSKDTNFVRTIDFRIDIGILFNGNKSDGYFLLKEISIPIRIDKELPIWFVGINFTYIFNPKYKSWRDFILGVQRKFEYH